CVTETDRDEDVEPRATTHEKPDDIRRLTHEILRGCRFMIDVTRVDLDAALQQQPRDLDRARAMQRRLAVAAARIHYRLVRVEQFAHAVDHAEMRGREDV